MRHSTLLSTALLATLAGCGTHERPPEEVARGYVASDEPGKCEDADPAFLERQSHKEGDAALEACRESVARTSPPKDVRLESSDVEEDRATVRLRASGMPVKVTLRRLGDRWLVTSLTAVAHPAR